MATTSDKMAPYAPLANVIGLIRRRRDRGLPEILNADKLAQLGIPEGNISRTLQALRLLDLIDEEGRQTTSFNRLGIAKGDEYPVVLADILRRAYHDVFAVIGDNPNDATDFEIDDAFRGYQPESQRNRIVLLFRGLCQEAGLIAGGPPETHMRSRATPPNKQSSSQSNGAKKPPSEPKEAPFGPDTDDVSNQKTGHSDTETPIMSTPEYAIMKGVLSRLPFGKKWTQAERKKWLRAVAANVDMLFELEDPDTGLEMEEDIFRP
jgi:Family of unknown function (DUF5343)